MTTAEFYDYVGGDYDDVKCRFMKDELISRFLRMLPDDGSMDELNAAVAAGSSEGAFRAVHTLKGVALNLGLSSLANACSAMTEAIRGRSEMCSPELYEAVRAEYARVRDGLDRLDA